MRKLTINWQKINTKWWKILIFQQNRLSEVNGYRATEWFWFRKRKIRKENLFSAFPALGTESSSSRCPCQRCEWRCLLAEEDPLGAGCKAIGQVMNPFILLSNAAEQTKMRKAEPPISAPAFRGFRGRPFPFPLPLWDNFAATAEILPHLMQLQGKGRFGCILNFLGFRTQITDPPLDVGFQNHPVKREPGMRCPGFVSPAGCGTKEGTRIFLLSRHCVNQLLIEGCAVAGAIWDR